jgi:hypothetical protein
MICFHVSLSGSKGRSPNLDHVSLWKTARGGEVLTRDEGNFGCTLGGTIGKDREWQTILKTDQRTILLELGMGENF